MTSLDIAKAALTRIAVERMHPADAQLIAINAITEIAIEEQQPVSTLSPPAHPTVSALIGRDSHGGRR